MELGIGVNTIGFYDKLVLILLIISDSFAWVAYTNTGWGEVVSGPLAGTHYGLWRICSTVNEILPACVSADGWAKDWYAASQAMVTFGFLGINAALVLQGIYLLLPKCIGRGEIAMSTAFVCFMTGLLYLIGVIVFGVKFKEDFIDRGNSNPDIGEFKLGYSFALSVVALTLEVLAGVLVLLINFKATGTDPQVTTDTCAA